MEGLFWVYPDLLTHSCDPSTWEPEIGVSEFEASLPIEKHSFKNVFLRQVFSL